MEELSDFFENILAENIVVTEDQTEKRRAIARSMTKSPRVQRIICEAFGKLHGKPAMTNSVERDSKALSPSRQPDLRVLKAISDLLVGPLQPLTSVLLEHFEKLRSQVRRLKSLCGNHIEASLLEREAENFNLTIEKARRDTDYSQRLVSHLNRMNEYEPPFYLDIRDISHDAWTAHKLSEESIEKDKARLKHELSKIQSSRLERENWLKMRGLCKVERLEKKIFSDFEHFRTHLDRSNMILEDVRLQIYYENYKDEEKLTKRISQEPEDLSSAIKNIRELLDVKDILTKKLSNSEKTVKESQYKLEKSMNSNIELFQKNANLMSSLEKLKNIANLLLKDSKICSSDKLHIEKDIKEGKISMLEDNLRFKKYRLDKPDTSEIKEVILETPPKVIKKNRVSILSPMTKRELLDASSPDHDSEHPEIFLKYRAKSQEVQEKTPGRNRRKSKQIAIKNKSTMNTDPNEGTHRSDSKVHRSVQTMQSMSNASYISTVSNVSNTSNTSKMSNLSKTSNSPYPKNSISNFNDRKESYRRQASKINTTKTKSIFKSSEQSATFSQNSFDSEIKTHEISEARDTVQEKPENLNTDSFNDSMSGNSITQTMPIKVEIKSTQVSEELKEAKIPCENTQNFAKNLQETLQQHHGFNNVNSMPLNDLLELKIDSKQLKDMILDNLASFCNQGYKKQFSERLESLVTDYTPMINSLISNEKRRKTSKTARKSTLAAFVEKSRGRSNTNRNGYNHKLIENASTEYYAEFDIEVQKRGLKHIDKSSRSEIWDSIICRRVNSGEKDDISSFMRHHFAEFADLKGKLIGVLESKDLNAILDFILLKDEPLIKPRTKKIQDITLNKWTRLVCKMRDKQAKKLKLNVDTENCSEVWYQLANNIKHVTYRLQTLTGKKFLKSMDSQIENDKHKWVYFPKTKNRESISQKNSEYFRAKSRKKTIYLPKI